VGGIDKKIEFEWSCAENIFRACGGSPASVYKYSDASMGAMNFHRIERTYPGRNLPPFSVSQRRDTGANDVEEHAVSALY
jgi:hypothetical protein